MLRSLALVTAIGLFLVVLMGALVTDTSSGTGCGRSWPLCHGRFIPAFAVHTAIEFSHRAVAGVIGVLVVILAVWVWRAYPARPRLRALALLGAVFVWIQALLGAADVLWPQVAAILALHFGFSLIAFAGVLLLLLELGRPAAGAAPTPRSPLPPGLGAWAWGVFIYIYGLIYLGAYVAHTASALACTGWPLCGGALIPPLHGALGIAFAHRGAALIGVVLVAWLQARTAHLRAERPDLAAAGRTALYLILLQAGSGAVVALTHASMGSLLLHGTLVAALFGALAYLGVGVLPEPAPAPTG